MNKKTLKGIIGLSISTLVVFLIILSTEVNKLKEETNLQESELAIAYENVDNLKKDIMILRENKESLEETIEVYSEKYDEYINMHETLKIDNINISEENEELKENNTALHLYLQKKFGVTIESTERVKVEITKYTDQEGYWALDDPRLGTMASGRKTYRGAAAMPRSIPFNTEVVIEYDEHPDESSIVYTTEDRGGAIVEKNVNNETVYKMDIWTDSYSEAYNWGVHKNIGAYLYKIKK